MATVFDPNSANQANNQQEQDDQQSNPTQLQTVGTAAPAAQATSSQGPMASSKPQGSGRFTNIQKYLQANQSGGQNIANKIGQNISQDVTKQQDQAQKYNAQLGNSIANANQQAQLGQQYTQQLKGIGNDINAATTAGFDQRANQNIGSLDNFVNDPNFGQFQNIQSGRAIDENLLANQQQRTYQQAQAAAQAAQQAQGQLGNEGGRFELLRQAFGGAARPGYSQGQQRLDQVLLGQGGGLGQVQQQVGGLARDTQQFQKTAAEQANEVSRLAAQEQGLQSDINTQAGANEKSYIDMLNGFVDPLNQQRQKEFEGLGSSLNSYVPTLNEKTGKLENKPYTPGLNADQMAKLGLTDNNTGVYNTFKDAAFTGAAGDTPEQKYANLANVIANKGAQAQGFQDVANQTDVNRYSALAKILGKTDPQLTQASQLGDAYTAKSDSEGGLKGRLAAEQKRFDGLDNFNWTTNVPGGSVTGAQSVADMIAQGHINPDSMHDNYGYTIRPGQSYANGDAGFGNNMQKALYNKLPAALQKFMDAQNYSQTLGGKRETWLDTERLANQAKQGITPKMDATPITETDPSLKRNGTK